MNKGTCHVHDVLYCFGAHKLHMLQQPNLRFRLAWNAHSLGHGTGRMTKLYPVLDGMAVISHAREEGHRIAHDVMGERAQELMGRNGSPLQHQDLAVLGLLLLARAEERRDLLDR